MTNLANRIKIIAFDIFGTVVDWHGSVKREIEEMRELACDQQVLIRRQIGVESLHYVSIDGLYRAMGEAGRKPDAPQYPLHSACIVFPTVVPAALGIRLRCLRSFGFDIG